jgi:hypothetical protein
MFLLIAPCSFTGDLYKGSYYPSSSVKFKEFPFRTRAWTGSGQKKASSSCGSDIRANYLNTTVKALKLNQNVIAGHEPCAKLRKLDRL